MASDLGIEAGVIAGNEAGVDAGDEAGEGAGNEAGVVAGNEADMMTDLAGTPYEEGLDRITVGGCPSSALGQNAIIAQEGVSTHIHPAVVWDGEAFWATWNIANEEGKFETWAGRFACDFSFIVPPFAVEQISGMNDVDPAIAVFEDVVLIAWARDNSFAGGSEYNLSTHLATFDRSSGMRLTMPKKLEVKTIEADTPTQALETSSEGEELDQGNRWMVNVAAYPEVGFILSGSWGDPSVSSFRAYLVHLDTQANVLGSAWLADPAGRNHQNALLSVSPRGHIDLVWKGTSGEGAEGFFARSWRANLPSVLRSFVGRDWSSAASMHHPHLSYVDGLNEPVLREEVDLPWIVGSNNAGQVTVIDSNGEESGISGGRQPYLGVLFAPKMLTGYQRVQGTKHKVWRRSIESDRSIGLPELISIEETVAPYPLSVAHFEEGSLYLWAEGNSPNFVLRASLVAETHEGF